MHEIETEIDIAANAEQVWSILTDLAAYPSWNPFIRDITGSIETGQRLTVSIHPTGELGAGRVRFTQGEKFGGVLVGFAKASLDRGTKAGFIAMNAALKKRAENLTV